MLYLGDDVTSPGSSAQECLETVRVKSLFETEN